MILFHLIQYLRVALTYETDHYFHLLVVTQFALFT